MRTTAMKSTWMNDEAIEKNKAILDGYTSLLDSTTLNQSQEKAWKNSWCLQVKNQTSNQNKDVSHTKS